MFGSRTYCHVLVVALAVLAAVATADRYIIRGKFKENRAEWTYGYMQGEFFYLYDSQSKENCRLRLDYHINSTLTISDLYDYSIGARFSNGPEKCTAVKIEEYPDPWWISGDLYTKTTDPAEGGMVWYQRTKDDGNNTYQVRRILMKENSAAPSEGYVGKIAFYNGHKLTVSEVRLDNSLNDNFFKPDSKCPDPTCPIYADLVFVVDTSGSVNYTEWNYTVQFVNAVMNSFTFGPNAVEAAVVQFNGQDRNRPYFNLKDDPLCTGKKRVKKDADWTNAKEFQSYGEEIDRMTTALASGRDSMKRAILTSNKTYLQEVLNSTIINECKYFPNKAEDKCQAFKDSRGTCQALGLDLAMKILSRSTRAQYNYTKPPNRIVIAVTDGADNFPNMTYRNATILKEQYNATLIEVGVALECQYDKNYLINISSKIGANNQSLYFDALTFQEMMKIVDQLFRPVCDSDTASECGTECGGFCGGGLCLCPECGEPPDVCHEFECGADHLYSSGCVLKESVKVGDVCTSYVCDPNKEIPGKTQKGEWVPVPNKCTELRNQYPGECRNVYCDVEFGGCRVNITNKTYCKKYERSACEEWECTPLEDEVLNENLQYEGCRVKVNDTQKCINNLGKRSSCIAVKCTGKGATCEDMETDICTDPTDECFIHSCLQQSNGEYKCGVTPISHPDDNKCVEWVCNASTHGWVVKVDRTKNDYCKNKFIEQHGEEEAKCKDFYCNPTLADGEVAIEGGCYYTVRKGCASQCTTDQDATCMKYGKGNSTVDRCILDYCIVKSGEGGQYTLGCASDKGDDNEVITENCLSPNSESAKRAKETNEKLTNQCCTPVCVDGKCTVEDVPLPEGMNKTFCMEPVCRQKSDGSWGWVMIPTKLNNNCLSDDCFYRECVDDKGCVAYDNCTNQTDECFSYSCERDSNDKPICQATDLTVNFSKLECMQEVCINGKKQTKYSECVSEDKCMKGTCVQGTCKYTKLSPEENDICKTYKCDPKTGKWNSTPNCDDGLYCTIDECWNYGSFYECHHERVDCAGYISMKGYDCFFPICKETIINGSGAFQCVRKLMTNAFIDICGNCLKDKSEESSESGNTVLLQCTEAPDEPLVVETIAAATIALIIIGAVIAGATLATTTVVGTRSLIKRARAARGQVAQSNPMYEGAETELTNPAYAG